MTKIDKAGVYDLDMETYHSDCCAGPSVSASGLSTILQQCPAIFWETSALNPGRTVEPESRALSVGSAAHALTLGEPEFNAKFVVCPYEKLNANPGKQWHDEWKRRVADGEETRSLIRAAEFEDVKAMAAAIKRSPQVARAFSRGRPEVSLIWQDTETGIWLKSRPDWLPEDPQGAWLIDYKTTHTLDPRKFSQNAFEFGYHIQAAMQLDAVEAVMGRKPLGIAHVAQEKAPPYLAELRLFTPEQIDYGRAEYRRALRIFAGCWAAWKAGKPDRVAWPGYTETPAYIETPYYIAKRMEESRNGNHDQNQPETADASRNLRAG